MGKNTKIIKCLLSKIFCCNTKYFIKIWKAQLKLSKTGQKVEEVTTCHMFNKKWHFIEKLYIFVILSVYVYYFVTKSIF